MKNIFMTTAVALFALTSPVFAKITKANSEQQLYLRLQIVHGDCSKIPQYLAKSTDTSGKLLKDKVWEKEEVLRECQEYLDPKKVVVNSYLAYFWNGIMFGNCDVLPLFMEQARIIAATHPIDHRPWGTRSLIELESDVTNACYTMWQK